MNFIEDAARGISVIVSRRIIHCVRLRTSHADSSVTRDCMFAYNDSARGTFDEVHSLNSPARVVTMRYYFKLRASWHDKYV
jgi:hypothetical protein